MERRFVVGGEGGGDILLLGGEGREGLEGVV